MALKKEYWNKKIIHTKIAIFKVKMKTFVEEKIRS